MIGKSVRLVLGSMAALGIVVSSPFVVAEAINTQNPIVESAQQAFDGPRVRFDANMDEYLADALGITVEELQTAKGDAHQAMLTDAVADGTLSQEEADLILARRALADYIDRGELTADVLGITVEELQAARDEGTDFDELIEEAGFENPEAFRNALQAAFEEAANQAVEDGIITAEQAEKILSEAGNGPRRRGPNHGPGGPNGQNPPEPGA